MTTELIAARAEYARLWRIAKSTADFRRLTTARLLVEELEAATEKVAA